jgi:hypothetical protein
MVCGLKYIMKPFYDVKPKSIFGLLLVAILRKSMMRAFSD